MHRVAKLSLDYLRRFRGAYTLFVSSTALAYSAFIYLCEASNFGGTEPTPGLFLILAAGFVLSLGLFAFALSQIRARERAELLASHLLASERNLKHANEELEGSIAEGRRRGHELEEMIARHEATLECSSEGILVVNRHGQIAGCNQHFVRMWMMPQSLIVGGKDDDVLSSVRGLLRDPEAFLRKTMEVRANPDGESFQTLHLRNGRVLECHSRPQRIDGQSAGRVWNFRDVTSHHRAEEKLRDSEALYHSLVQSLPQSIHRKDLQGRYIFANEPFCRRNSFKLDEILGKTDAELFPAELAARYQRDDQTALSSKPDLDQTETVIGKNGAATYRRVIRSRVLDSRGTITGIQAVSWDITHSIHARTTLAAEKERLKVTLRSIGDGVIATDLHGNVTLINAAAEELTGWPHKDSEQPPLASVFKRLDPKTRQPIADLGDAPGEPDAVGRSGRQAILLATDGKERLIEWRSAALRDGQCNTIGAVIVFQDITTKLRLEAEAVKASRIESVGLLAGGIAHDFRNILTMILGNLSLAKQASTLSPETHSRLALVEKATLRAKELTHQLLTFAKGGAPVRQTASLLELVRETAEFALRGSNVRARFELPLELPPAEIDAGQISQVLHNLVLNAIQAMPSGGELNITAANFKNNPGSELPLPPGDYVRVTVRDHGPGIAADILPNVFDPYFTTKSGGTGLGLATAFSILKRHEGCLTAESTPGQGAAFHLYLPASMKTLPPTVVLNPSDYHGQGKVLVMDDEPEIREMACTILTHYGYEPMAVKDGTEAVIRYSQARRAGYPFTAVIMDLTIPGGMGGRDALQQIRALDPDVKAIVSSGYSNDPVMADHRGFGFSGVIEKPYTIEEFARVLHEVILPGRPNTLHPETV